MRTVETLTATRATLEALFDEAAPLLGEAERRGWAKQKIDLLAAADRLIDTNRRLEAKRGEIRGEGYDAPKPRDVGPGFISESYGGEIRYMRSVGVDQREVAFVDKGNRVEIRDSTDREVVLGGMTLAAKKWSAIEIDGAESFKTSVAELAVERGITIANPKLKERNAAEQGMSAVHDERVETPLTEGAPPRLPLRTPEEAKLALDQVRLATEQEATRETRQAIEARRLDETTPAYATVEHPYRSAREAQTAREAARSMEDHPDRAAPINPGQSEKIQELSREQKSYLEQARAFNQEEVARVRREDRDESQSEK